MVGWAIAACANLVKSTCTKLLSGFRRRSRSCWGSSTGCGRSSKLRCAVAALLRVSAVASITVPDVCRRRQRTPAGLGSVGICTMHRTMHRTMHAAHRCMLHRELTVGMASRSHDCWPTHLACSTAQVQAEQMSNEELRFRLETLQVVCQRPRCSLASCPVSNVRIV